MKLFESSKENGNRIAEINFQDRIVKGKQIVSNYLSVNTGKRFQTFLGFGGALTESSAYVLSQLPEDLSSSIVESYYDSNKGNGYVFARSHLNSCDFSLENWSCLPEKTDSINDFSMERPDKYVVPLIKKAQQYCPEINLLISPWSPPAWMKSNNDMNHGGKLLKQYYLLWSQNYVRYIQELKARGITVKYLTVQNEPAAIQTWDSCEYSAEEEAVFVTEYLYPELQKAGLSEVKILVWDHNRNLLAQRFSDSMKVPGADKCIAGAAYHWYSGDQYDNINYVRETFADKLIFFTEGCVEFGPRPGKWFTGERYGHNIINDLNSGCNAWIDWNIALDMEGGPNHVGNFCDAPVLVDAENKKVLYESSYYYIGHFSRFIKPGAVRVESSVSSWMLPSTVDGKIGNMVEATAFINPDRSLAVVLMNRTEDNVYIEFFVDGKKKNIFIPERTIQTFVFSEDDLKQPF